MPTCLQAMGEAVVKQIGKGVPPYTANALILEALRLLLIFASVMHDLIASTLKVA
jgi:hypothetical protein